ncbi:MAG: VWA domain-containing protein [Deltaproteobacteria bacterium]|nr:VWA domain-containing protein [Deltaproteobacteria bacterium]
MVALGQLAACAEPVLVLGRAGSSGDSGVHSGAEVTSMGTVPDLPPFDACDPELGCQDKIDVLFVIDNSGTMGEEQLNLAKNFPLLVEQLQSLEDGHGNRVGADVNIMVTTTDVDNPSCHGAWVKPDYVPARGAPVSTPCTERIARFTGLGMPPPVVEQACTDVCAPALPVAPRDQFIHFDRDGDNVDAGDAAAALACVGPQGIDGCGYESPLEAMSQALNPAACWNDPARCDDPAWSWIEQPFLRDGAVLAIAIITDETDCSVRDFSIMTDPDFLEVNPVTDIRSPSSALCWHAGARCDDLDPATGVYAQCVQSNHDDDGSEDVADDRAVLQPVSRYARLLHSLRDQGREVIMLGILGVPEVTEHAALPRTSPSRAASRRSSTAAGATPSTPSATCFPTSGPTASTRPTNSSSSASGPAAPATTTPPACSPARRSPTSASAACARASTPPTIPAPRRSTRPACAAASSRSATTISAPRSAA